MATSISQRLTTILFALGIVQASLIGSFAWFTNISFPLPRLLFIGAAVIVYMAAGILATRHECWEENNAIRLIWGIGLAMRVMVIPLTPELSDDVYRYLWDGHVQYSGVNPYLYAPADPALESIRTLWHEKINHPDIPTLYPPLTQLLFLTTWIIGGTIWVAKLLWVAFDILTGSVIVRIARSLERPVLPILVWYFWSPLLIVEVAWNGHFDIIGVFWLTLLLWVAVSRKATGRGGWLGALLAAATMTKLAPAVLFPPFWHRYGKVLAGYFLVVCALLSLPYASAGIEPLTKGLWIYLKDWIANPGAFLVIKGICGNSMVARMISGIIVVLVMLFTMIRRQDPEHMMLIILGAGILFSPTVHPWYVIWLLPFAALTGHPGFLALSGLIFLGYWGLGEYQRSGDWPQPTWVLLTIWLPVWALLAIQPFRKKLPSCNHNEANPH